MVLWLSPLLRFALIDIVQDLPQPHLLTMTTANQARAAIKRGWFRAFFQNLPGGGYAVLALLTCRRGQFCAEMVDQEGAGLAGPGQQNGGNRKTIGDV